MTTASELLYNRRSRFGRSTLQPDFDSSLVRISHLNHNNRRDRRELDSYDHHLSFPERESVQLNQADGLSASGNVINSENYRGTRNRQRFSENDRLPGPVLLARERLFERLRGVSPSGNRRRNRAYNDSTVGGNTRLVDPEDSATAISRDSNSRMDRLLALHERRKFPPLLTQGGLDRLSVEVFSNEEKGDERAIMGESRNCRLCSICLESFLQGDELIRLPCGHRFHFCCLDPWVQTRGDCPYCRTGIVATCD